MTAVFLELVKISILDPKRGGRIVLSYDLSQVTIGQFAALVVVLSVIVLNLSLLTMGPVELSPFVVVFGQILALGVLILATFLVGRLFGGTGNLEQTVVLICWLQLVMLLLQFLQIALSAVLPFSELPLLLGMSIEDAITVISLFLFFWLYANFVTVLHGFHSAMKVFVGTILTIFAFAIGLFSLLTAVVLT